jgi:hypothetical protein
MAILYSMVYTEKQCKINQRCYALPPSMRTYVLYIQLYVTGYCSQQPKICMCYIYI